MTGRLLTVVLVGVLAALGALQVADPWRDAPAAGPVPRVDARADERLVLGVTTLALARNASRPWEPRDLAEVDAFDRAAARRSGIVMWFADWASSEFDARQARAVAARGSVPEISWEPWDASRRTARQPRYRLRTITAGAHDATIRRWARAIARHGDPIRLRFAHEMNGRWYPWGETVNGNRPGDYARAWRHVRKVFAQEGADNVTWVWCPVAGDVPARLFPGSGAVDVAAVSGFNGGDRLFRRRWRSFAEAFSPALDRVAALAPGTPVVVSEVASTEHGGDKAAWITGMFDELRRRPEVRAVVWFHVDKEADWRITSSEASRRAFATGLRRMTEWAPPG